jgi:hypothetical protein
MDLVSLIITLVVVGVVLWLINTYVPMEARIKQLLNIAVIVLVVLWLLFSVLGLGHGNLGAVRVG